MQVWVCLASFSNPVLFFCASFLHYSYKQKLQKCTKSHSETSTVGTNQQTSSLLFLRLHTHLSPCFFLYLSLSFCNDLPEVQHRSSLSISKRWGRFCERTPSVMSSPWTPRIQKAPDMLWESPRTTLDTDRPGFCSELRACRGFSLNTLGRGRETPGWLAILGRVCVCVCVFTSVNEIGVRKCVVDVKGVYERSNIGLWERGVVRFNRISLTFFEGPNLPKSPSNCP